MTERGWKRRFDEPIPLPRGRQILTLRDAGNYITKLGITYFARFVYFLAVESDRCGRKSVLIWNAFWPSSDRWVFDPTRKGHHWGRRNLARDR